MSKKLIIIIVAAVLVIGGGTGGYLYWKHKKQAASQAFDANGNPIQQTDEIWNPYATSTRYLETLPDFLLSANNGKHVVKMTVTLDLDNETNMKKFLGLSSDKAKIAQPAKGVVPPMEVTINAAISSFMLKTDETKLQSKDTLETDLKTYLNEKLGLGDFIKTVYIENYVLQ